MNCGAGFEELHLDRRSFGELVIPVRLPMNTARTASRVFVSNEQAGRTDRNVADDHDAVCSLLPPRVKRKGTAA